MTGQDQQAISKAYDQLEAAIQAVLEARGYASDGLVLTDWVVALVQQGVPDADHSGLTSFIRLVPLRQPWHHTMGVLRGVMLELDRDFTAQEDS